MSDEDLIEFASTLAETVLHRFGEGAPPWRVLAVERYQEFRPAPTGLLAPNSLLITLGNSNSNDETVGVYFSLDVSRDDAVVATAGQIQDHAIEETHGRALPPCPGHQHPMNPGWIDGVASWICPFGTEHHSEPIMH
jgi:hypothetical protein